MVTVCQTFANPSPSTVDEVLKRKTCAERHDQQIDCDYFAGKDFHLTIAGVGLRDASITFATSNEEGDFYGTVGIMHGCVIVKRGRKGLDPKAGWGPGSMVDYAFISPRNGKVYSDWESCRDSR